MTVHLPLRLPWVLCAVLAFFDAIGLVLTGIGIAWTSVLVVALAVAALLVIERLYAKLRPDPRLANLAALSAQLLVYTAVAGILSYLLTTTARPLIDADLVAADRALGLDWPAMAAWGKAHFPEHLILILAYFSLIPQLVLILVILFYKGWFERARGLFWLFALTSLACVLIGAAFPAAGAFVFFNAYMNTDYVKDFLALREGTLRTIDLGRMQGIVQFPSFHLAMALILTYAARGIRVLFPLLIIVNSLVIAATPLVGGHHFADLWGGALVTLAAILALRLKTPQA